MIRFLFKGLLRDRHRSLFPILIVIIGVMLTVLLHCWIMGIMGDMVDYNAKFLTGHVKVMTHGYKDKIDQLPNDFALLEVSNLIEELNNEFPEMTWVKRIRFGGLLDTPDEKRETRTQGFVIGLAADLFSENSSEISRLNIEKALGEGGHLPKKTGEILISEEFAKKLDVKLKDEVMLLSSTMHGSMATENFTISGTVEFGAAMLDRGSMIIDISDAQNVLDMNDASGEILGYFKNGLYNDRKAEEVTKQFNAKYTKTKDEDEPVMMRLKEQNDLASMLDYISKMVGYFVFGFVFAMSIVLWNAGLIGGLRRYGEVGVRLAIGENKNHVYRSLIYESVLIGIFGSVIGTVIGLGFAYILQTKGINVSSMIKSATMMFPNVFRAHITPPAYFIGFLPGLFSTVLGTVLSGIGIYKRKTAQLFKELEA
jgi:putative ABC transport system permease protein